MNAICSGEKRPPAATTSWACALSRRSFSSAASSCHAACASRSRTSGSSRIGTPSPENRVLVSSVQSSTKPRGAQHRRGEDEVEHDRPRHPVQRAAVAFVPGQGQPELVVQAGLGAVVGDERVVGDDVLAAGRPHARGVPVVVDHVLPLHQKGRPQLAQLGTLDRPGAGAGAGADAQHHVVTVVAARGERPAPTDPVAAVDPLGLPVGGVRRRRDPSGAVAAHISCCVSSGSSPSCQGCTPITPRTQPADGETQPTSMTASRNSARSTSPPPQRAGCMLHARWSAASSRRASRNSRASAAPRLDTIRGRDVLRLPRAHRSDPPTVPSWAP